MFKRANKVTALLVAAASIMATVPAMAADTTRLGNKDGTVKQGIAYGDGSYAYYGYKTDDDETGIYVSKDGEQKPKLDDDLQDYRFNNDSKFGTKYAYAKENSNDDEYLVDLGTGKIVDDETVEEKANNAKDKFVSKVKKADRYDNIIERSSDIASMFDDSAKVSTTSSFVQILPGQFGDVYYQFKVTTDASAQYTYVDEQNNTTTSAAIYTGFSDENGKYVDLTKDTNIRVYSTKTGRAEYVKEFGKFYKDTELKVDLIDVKPLAQDKDYIYTLTKVAVTDSNNAGFLNAKHLPQLQYFVQKISKAQDGKDSDGAYTAKSIDSYQLQATNVTGVNNKIYDNGDMTDAFDVLMGTGKDCSNDRLLGIVVKDGNMYVAADRVKDIDTTKEKSDKLEIYKLTLGKVKKDVLDSLASTTLKSDVDTNAVKKDDDTDDGDIVDFYNLASTNAVTEAEDDGIQNLEVVTRHGSNDANVSKYGVVQLGDRDLYRTPSVSIDTKGVLWAVEKGTVVSFDGLTKKDVYTVDRAMDAIDVYDENNLIVWDTTGDVYTNISEGHKATADDGKGVGLVDAGTTTQAQVGWITNADGTYSFNDVNGNRTANYWANDNGTYYWIKADGIMATGWAQDTTGTWYYLNTVSGGPLGSMKTGWLLDGSTWYYLNANGSMATGWIQDGANWYYLNGNGSMAANTTVDGYVLGSDGAWIK